MPGRASNSHMPARRRAGSICTGAFLLARAGLLDGRRVATHWAFAAELAKRYPKVNVDPEPIWAQDDNFYTSAGIDLSLALLEEDHGAARWLWRLPACWWSSCVARAIRPSSAYRSGNNHLSAIRCVNCAFGWRSILQPIYPFLHGAACGDEPTEFPACVH